MNHENFMYEALKSAKEAFDSDEIPIGCVIVKDGEIIGRGFNRRNSEKNVLFHAEIVAIDMACKHIGDWRLEDMTLYVTVEPCAMCAGAIIQSRIKRVVFGTYNNKFGCGGSILNILQDEKFNHQCEVVTNVLEEECKKIMQTFFKKKREKQLTDICI